MKKKNFEDIKMYFQMTTNNILITFTDLNGNTIDWFSSGRLLNKGPQKTSAAAVSSICSFLTKRIIARKTKFLEIIFKGKPKYRYLLLKNLKAAKLLTIKSIVDKTPVPHSGCRLTKKKRK